MDNWGIVILELLYTYIYIYTNMCIISCFLFLQWQHTNGHLRKINCFFLNCKLYLKSVRKGKLLMDNDGE